MLLVIDVLIAILHSIRTNSLFTVIHLLQLNLHRSSPINSYLLIHCHLVIFNLAAETSEVDNVALAQKTLETPELTKWMAI